MFFSFFWFGLKGLNIAYFLIPNMFGTVLEIRFKIHIFATLLMLIHSLK